MAADTQSCPCRGAVSKAGLLGDPAAPGGNGSGALKAGDNSAEVIELKRQQKELGGQMEAASKTIQSLRAVNAELHAFVVGKS